MLNNLVREHVQSIKPYEPVLPLDVLAEELKISRSSLIKLDANENPFGLLPEIKGRLCEVDDYHIYPDPESRQLASALAEVLDVQENQIIVGAGADEVIDLLFRLLIEPGDVVIDCPPSFGVYRFDAAINHAAYLAVPRLLDFSLDIENIERVVRRKNVKMIFVTSPNNPTGNVISAEVLERLLALPALIVLDEAYIDFADRSLGYAHWVKRYENLCIIRTFSKWAGLAGLRVGYGIVSAGLRAEMMKIKQPYNVSVAGSVAALAALANKEKLVAQINQIKNSREEFYSSLSAISWLSPLPSQGNFILMRVDNFSAKKVWLWMRQKGILLRYFDKPGLDNYLRCSIGLPEQLASVINAFKEYENENS